MDMPKRKPLRLPEYDYSAPGAYFVTICTQDRKNLLSEISVGEGLAPPALSLTAAGKITEEQICSIPKRFPSVAVDKYVIMPNHIHLIVSIRGDSGGASPSPTLFDVVRVLKSMTARLAKASPDKHALWQRGYYEHVIRNERDYLEIWDYIDANPAKWAEDRYYCEG